MRYHEPCPGNRFAPRSRSFPSSSRTFKEKAVFYLDEPVGPVVAEILGLMGYKVRTAADCGMVGRDDADQAALCWRDGMILVTHDRDLLDDRTVPEHRHPGIVVLDTNNSTTAAYRAAWFMGSIVGPFGGMWRAMKLLINANGEITHWYRNTSTGAAARDRYRWLPHRDIEIWVDDE